MTNTMQIKQLTPLNSEVETMLRACFQTQAALVDWDAKITGLAEGHFEITLPRSQLVTQQHGYFHGGVIGTLADVAGGFAANSVLMPDNECVTAEYKINFVAPGIGEKLIARGKLVKPGKTLVIATAEIFAVNQGSEKLCALMQQTLFVIPNSSTKK
ncbi:MAG: PaaI family thioesterase [Burkholderiaceae bacterium]|jgi:uncharacterized protein (TIGR00369 family)|nr:PaaI family thioesterase [Burkholderiaceae bacterium]